MNGRVYLAGPIAHTTVDEACIWRQVVAGVLSDSGIDVRDPMRMKRETLRTMIGDNRIGDDFNSYKNAGTFFTSRAIMSRDFNDVKQSDVLLVNLLGTTVPSLGTIMELAWAYALQKPAIVVIEESGNVHENHPMIHEAMSFRVHSLRDGINAVQVVLGLQPTFLRQTGVTDALYQTSQA